jgi:uncharacterized protein (DUF736 family)
MSEQYDNTNSGAIFKNDKKETDSHPEYKGSINVEGKDYWASVWVNTSKAGQQYMSIKVTPKDAQQAAPSSPQVTQVDNSLINNSDIPF